MKVLKVLVAATMLFAAKQASALGDVAVFGGYTTVNMTDLNTQLDAINILAGGGLTVNKPSSGYYIGVDAGFSVLPFLKVGPRFEYLGVGQAKLAQPGTTNFYTLDSSMMMYEAGVSTSFDLPLTGLSVGGGLWLGYGMAGTSFVQSFGGTSYTDNYSGGAFVSEIQAQVGYKIIPVLSVGLDLGYRLASVSQMKATADNTNTGVKSGDTFKEFTSSTTDQPFDFSGINIGGRVSFNF